MRSTIREEQKDAFELLAHPTWIFDVDERAVLWGNAAAVAMWRAEDLASMTARDYSDMSEAAFRRVVDTLQRCIRGDRVLERWTFYPLNDIPLVVDCAFSAIRLTDGRMALLIQGTLPSSPEIDSDNLRGVETLRHLPISVCQFDIHGRLVLQNPTAFDVFGPADGPLSSLVRRFADELEGDRVLQAARAGEVVRRQTELRTSAGSRWFDVELRVGRDPVTGQSLFLFVASDISELKRTEEQLTRARDEAESAARIKSEFIAMISHEIRTPLHGIIGFSDLLKQTELGRDQAGYLGSLRASASLLLRLINDVLDLSKIEVGSMRLEAAAFDLEWMVSKACATIAPLAADKGLSLALDIAGDVPRRVIGDSLRIEQVLNNLLGNAAKFTSRGGVSVHVTGVGDGRDGRDGSGEIHRVRIEVTDTGIGIPVDRIDSLFDKFTQVDISTSRRFGGTGLGLAICKLLVDLMDGTLGVSSQLGEGSCFWVELPLRSGESTDTPRPRRLESPAQPSLHILLADDNRLNQQLAATMLRRMGHQVTIAEDGAEAVELVQRETFDLVLMDIQMPIMDGLEATRAIRSHGLSERALPIIGLTASAVHENRHHYLDAGMNDCMSKPFRVGQLAAVLARNSSR